MFVQLILYNLDTSMSSLPESKGQLRRSIWQEGGCRMRHGEYYLQSFPFELWITEQLTLS